MTPEEELKIMLDLDKAIAKDPKLARQIDNSFLYEKNEK